MATEAIAITLLGVLWPLIFGHDKFCTEQLLVDVYSLQTMFYVEILDNFPWNRLAKEVQQLLQLLPTKLPHQGFAFDPTGETSTGETLTHPFMLDHSTF